MSISEVHHTGSCVDITLFQILLVDVCDILTGLCLLKRRRHSLGVDRYSFTVKLCPPNLLCTVCPEHQPPQTHLPCLMFQS